MITSPSSNQDGSKEQKEQAERPKRKADSRYSNVNMKMKVTRR